jgi:hypothetical protein
MPAGANRRADEVGNSDDAHLLVHCAVGVVVVLLYMGDGFVANALESTDMGELVVMRGCMEENRAPFPGPCQALAVKAAVPRIVSRGRRAVYLDLIVNGRTMRAFDMAGVWLCGQ